MSDEDKVEKLIEDAQLAYSTFDGRIDDGVVAALKTVAPLHLLAGVKAGTHVIVPVEPTEENERVFIAAFFIQAVKTNYKTSECIKAGLKAMIEAEKEELLNG